MPIDKLLLNFVCITFTIIITTAKVHAISIFTLWTRNFTERECKRIECKQNTINYGYEDGQSFSEHDWISTWSRVDSRQLTENGSEKKRQNSSASTFTWKRKTKKTAVALVLSWERRFGGFPLCYIISSRMNASDPRRFTAFVWCVREKKRRNLVQRELIQRPTDLNERRRDIKKNRRFCERQRAGKFDSTRRDFFFSFNFVFYTCLSGGFLFHFSLNKSSRRGLEVWRTSLCG